jgi:hypothetical protein
VGFRFNGVPVGASDPPSGLGGFANPFVVIINICIDINYGFWMPAREFNEFHRLFTMEGDQKHDSITFGR